jgi:hypothetical protein
MNKYKVLIASRPGFYEQYSGTVEVTAENEDAAVDAAFRKLKSGSFPDRNKDMWKVKEVARIF